MTYDAIFTKVSELLLMQLPVTPEKIKPEAKLIEDLGADSANIMILVCDIENEFDVQVDNEMLAQVSTVDDIVKYLEKTLN